MHSSIADEFDVPTNTLYALRDRLIQEKKPFIDLVSGNVNAQGIRFPEAVLSKALALATKKTRSYKPDPMGQKVARAAISRYYRQEGLPIPAHQLILTPGTSISYWYAFKVLADSGDEVLCPTPSYPLFDSIASLCGIKLIPYTLRENERWEIDFADLESRITSRTKAIVLISPHNPTGSVATEPEIQKLSDVAKRHNLAIISDEVFSPFVFTGARLPRPASTSAPLVITLNGFSKMLALPGIKIGWMAVTGNHTLVSKTIKALDMISDTFLPVNEMAQFAVPELLSGSQAFQKSYVLQIQERLALMLALWKKVPSVAVTKPEGGFFMTICWKNSEIDDEGMALRLLKNHRMLVHPGYFYDMQPNHLVLSIVNRPSRLRQAVAAIEKVLS